MCGAINVLTLQGGAITRVHSGENNNSAAPKQNMHMEAKNFIRREPCYKKHYTSWLLVRTVRKFVATEKACIINCMFSKIH